MTAPIAGADAPDLTAWVSVAQAAAMLNLTASRVAQLRREHRIEARRTALGWLYDPAAIRRFAASRATTTERTA